MMNFLNELADFQYRILSLLNRYEIVAGVSIAEALFGFLVMGIVISVFWKGGRA